MVEQARLNIPPRMEIDKSAELWMMAQARENYFRVAKWYSLKDLIQDGYLAWYRVVAGEMLKGPRQPGEPVSRMHQYKYITSRPHIMSLFQSTYQQHIHDLANKRTGLNEQKIEDMPYFDAPDSIDYKLNYKRKRAPDVKKPTPTKSVKALLTIASTPEGRAALLAPLNDNETLDERFRKLTGSSRAGIAGVLKQYLDDMTTFRENA